MKKRVFLEKFILTTCILETILAGCSACQKENITPVEHVYVEDQNINKYFNHFDEIYANEHTEYKSALSHMDEYSFSQAAYLGYLNIINSGIDINVALEELNNILTLAIIPTELGDAYYDLVGTLASTLSIYQNPFEVYYPLAYELHLLNCKLPHDELITGSYVCDDILEDYVDMTITKDEEKVRILVNSLVK